MPSNSIGPTHLTHFNDLTSAEDERLSLVEEEMGESIQAICKIRRHGFESGKEYENFEKGWIL